MCDVQEDMGKHLVPLASSDEGHQIEHKQKCDSLTKTWVIEMKTNVWRTGGHEQRLSTSKTYWWRS
jgi:hypothetical protein